MADLHLGIEPLAVVGLHRIDKVSLMTAHAGIAGKLTDYCALGVICGAATATAGIIALFAMYNITSAHVVDLERMPIARAVGQVAEPKYDRNRTCVVVSEQYVRRLAGIVPD